MTVMTLLFLCGCSSKTNVASADLYIQVKTAQAQASAYAQAMRDSKEQLVQVLPELNDPNPQPEAIKTEFSVSRVVVILLKIVRILF